MPTVVEDVPVNGTVIHMRVDGPDGADVIAFSNSLATDLTMWDSQVAALSDKYRVLRYDTRGHGASAPVPGPYSIDMLVDDALGLIAHVDAKRAHFVGCSLGALTVASIAVRGRPEIASIAFCDARADFPPEFTDGMNAMIAAVTAKGTGEIAPGFSERLTSAGARERDPAYAEKVRTMIRETSREGFAGCAEAIKASAVRPRIKDIRLPTLFVVGDQDAAVSIDLMKEMQAEVPGAKLAVIENAGHLSNMEQPAAFNKEIRQFIDSIH